MNWIDDILNKLFLKELPILLCWCLEGFYLNSHRDNYGEIEEDLLLFHFVMGFNSVPQTVFVASSQGNWGRQKAIRDSELIFRLNGFQRICICCHLHPRHMAGWSYCCWDKGMHQEDVCHRITSAFCFFLFWKVWTILVNIICQRHQKHLEIEVKLINNCPIKVCHFRSMLRLKKYRNMEAFLLGMESDVYN